jgi:hypothetical protein
MGQLENKQDDRLKPKIINDYIKCQRLSKPTKGRGCYIAL